MTLVGNVIFERHCRSLVEAVIWALPTDGETVCHLFFSNLDKYPPHHQGIKTILVLRGSGRPQGALHVPPCRQARMEECYFDVYLM